MFDLWKLGDFAPGDGIQAKAFAEEFDDSTWIDIRLRVMFTVP